MLNRDAPQLVQPALHLSQRGRVPFPVYDLDQAGARAIAAP